jgi:hypothetical protein
VGNASQATGDGHNEDASGHDDPLTEDLDQPTAERAGDQAHQRECRNDSSDFGVSDAEAPGENRQYRDQDAEADSDAERDKAEHVNLARE